MNSEFHYISGKRFDISKSIPYFNLTGKRFYLLFTSLFCSYLLFSQGKNYEKAKAEYANNNLKVANKLIEKSLEDPETKKDPRVRLLKSRIMYGIYKDKSLNPYFPDALKEALRYAEHDGDGQIEGENIYESKEIKAYFKALVKLNNKEALDAFNTDKFSKALPIFKRSLSFGLDTQALVMVGECYWQMKMRVESLSYFKRASRIIYDGVMEDSNAKILGYYKLPYRNLGRYYIDKKQYDTAYVIVKNGREILPNDPVLTEYTYLMMRFALEKVPPSGDYLSMVKQSLKDFPTDSFLNHRENSIYIFLLNGMAKANEQRQFDSLVMLYAKSKQEKAKSKNLELIKKYDIFAGQPPQAFLENLYKYFAEINLRDASYATFIRWIRFTNPINTVKAFNDFVKQQRPVYAEILFKRYFELNPKDNLPAKKAMLEYTVNKNKSGIDYYDLFPIILLNDAVAKDNPKDLTLKPKAKELRTRLVNEAIDSGDFVLARRIWKESDALYPDLKKALDTQWKKMIVQDFKMNYYGSRINPAGKKEAGIPEYKWKGDAERCIPGKMNDTLIGRLERRINYFRRAAG